MCQSGRRGNFCRQCSFSAHPETGSASVTPNHSLRLTATPPIPPGVLRGFEIGPTSDAAAVGRPGFSGARVYRVTGDHSPWCLKALPLTDVDLCRQRGLQRLLRHLATGGLTFIASPRTTAGGEPFLIEHNWLWQCEPWLSGEADRSPRVEHQRVKAAFQTLARWHERARHFVPEPGEAVWFRSHPAEPSPAARERATLLRQTVATELQALRGQALQHLPTNLHPAVEIVLGEIQRCGAAVAQELERWSARLLPIQPCLRDIWREHVLFEGDEVSGIIDPQAARCDSPALDLARLLGSLCGSRREAWTTALDAYHAVRPLAPMEEALIPALDRSGCLLAGLHWIKRLLPDGGTAETPVRAGCDRLWHFAERLASGPVGAGILTPWR